MNITKVIIIGGGVSGYSSAIYTSRAKLETLLIEGSFGGQLSMTTEVENFPGFPDGILGTKLAELMKQQAIKYGTKFLENKVIKANLQTTPFELTLEDNQILYAHAVIIATGANAKLLGVTGESVYWNNGISACAVCDGALPMFRNKTIAVVGGGDSAMEEANFLTRYANKVYLIHRSDKFRATKIMLERTKNNPKIEFITNTRVLEACGGKKLEYIVLENTKDNTTSQLPVQGMFYAIGHTPNSSLFVNQIDIDEDGYINTKPDSGLTNIPGVFAAGDVRDKKYKQAITASASGVMAAIDCARFL
jgi:thioredoxin reductase (NADPH)